MKKKFPSLHLNADDFIPATNDEKESLVVMRDSVNFWADGMRRLRKNKIAMISLVFILIIMFFAYVMPAFWPYSYEQQIKYSENLKPFEYSQTEQARIDAGEKVFPHICGTDKLGRDFAVRLMMGTRISLSVGLICARFDSRLDFRRRRRICRRLGRYNNDENHRYSLYNTRCSFDNSALARLETEA